LKETREKERERKTRQKRWGLPPVESGCGVMLSAVRAPDRPLYRGQLPFDDPLTIPGI